MKPPKRSAHSEQQSAALIKATASTEQQRDIEQISGDCGARKVAQSNASMTQTGPADVMSEQVTRLNAGVSPAGAGAISLRPARRHDAQAIRLS
ncbi:hypothetical protein SMY34_003217 [Cronobacter muytjensii]|nr:hypothetical protein [Cronobacter muytjensii]